jgi:hypothetical protein
MGLHLFSRSVHPELFEMCAVREFARHDYQIRIQITTSGHVIEFRHRHLTLSEVCSGKHQDLPASGRLLSVPIENRHFAQTTCLDRLHWESRYQIETVDPRVFLTLQQQVDQPQNFEGLIHQFASSGRIPMGGISYVNLQAFQKHVSLRSFHTFPDTCSVIKCESKFTLV